MSKTIPTIDLRLLKSDRFGLLDELRHALMEYGFFYISNYDEFLDQNIIIALNEESKSFFQLDDAEKNKIQMVNSKHFLGYNGLEKENTGGKIDWREQIDFCSADKELDSYYSVYDNLIGPNQYPSNDTLPFFKKSIKDFFFGLNEFSILITKQIFDSIDIPSNEASNFVDFKNPQNQFSKMKIINYPSKKELKKLNKNFSNQGCGSHKDSDFLTFLFQQNSNENSLQVQDLYGNWVDLPPKPNTIVCSVGQTLEYLTNGVCISSIHRVLIPKNQSRISIPFFQNIKLDSKLKPFTMTSKLLKERNERNKLIKQNVEFQFKPELGVPVSKSLFYNRIKAHRDVSEKWYPDLLKEIDQQLLIKKEESSKSLKIPKLPKEFERIKKIFNAFDNTVILYTMNHTADAKIHSLIPQIKNLTQFNVELKDILQIAYIWPDFIGLKLDDNDDYIIDLDDTKDEIYLKDINKRLAQFEKKLNDWFEKNYLNYYEIPTIKKSDLIKKSIVSKNLKRSKTEIIQKNTKKQKLSNHSLSLLQRINLKEKERLENQINPQDKYDLYLFEKLGQVLEIFASLRPDLPHSLTGLTERVVTSLGLTNALANEEASDLILKLAKEFPDDFKLFNGKSTSVLKWKDFDVIKFKEKLKIRLSNQNLQK